MTSSSSSCGLVFHDVDLIAAWAQRTWCISLERFVCLLNQYTVFFVSFKRDDQLNDSWRLLCPLDGAVELHAERRHHYRRRAARAKLIASDALLTVPAVLVYPCTLSVIKPQMNPGRNPDMFLDALECSRDARVAQIYLCRRGGICCLSSNWWSYKHQRLAIA